MRSEDSDVKPAYLSVRVILLYSTGTSYAFLVLLVIFGVLAGLVSLCMEQSEADPLSIDF